MRAVILIGVLGLTAEPAIAQGSGLCPGLSGSARTACLQAERAKAARATAEAERKAKLLERAHKVGCVVDGGLGAAGGAAAGAAGTIAGGPGGGVAAAGAYGTARAAVKAARPNGC